MRSHTPGYPPPVELPEFLNCGVRASSESGSDLLSSVCRFWIIPHTTHLLKIKQLKLCAESDKVSKEGIEMAFAAQVNQVRELSVVDVRKDSHQLFVDVFRRREECRWEVSCCVGVRDR